MRSTDKEKKRQMNARKEQHVKVSETARKTSSNATSLHLDGAVENSARPESEEERSTSLGGEMAEGGNQKGSVKY